jgi:hypothetical protein
MMHADRSNRVTLILLAVLLTAVGAAGGAASVGAFGTRVPHTPVIDNRVGSYIGAQGLWFWPAAAGLALIVVLAALRWLLALLFSTDRSGDLTFPEDRSAGLTTLDAGALTEAVRQEIESYRGVHAARARLIGDPDDADLVVTATLEETADLAALRQHIESGALAHAREAVGNPSMPIHLDLRVTSKRATRVS